jgi:serine/threonine protein kinase
MALPAGTLLKNERYQIQQLLARGGFGFIYLTYDSLAQRDVVLKELIPALVGDAEVLRRFSREGRTMQRLSHPFIARTESMFKEQGNHYLVQEYLSGGVLSDWTNRGRRLDLSKTARVVTALSDALAYMHRMGITHCDLNPSNVLFDEQGHPKLIDLGIAHISDAFVHRHWHTQRGFPMGTILYMAPEQIDGVRDDPRVDQYALAAMTYQLLSGRYYLPFDLQNTPGAHADNVNRVRDDMPEPLPEAPLEVEEVLMRALAKDPNERFPDITSFGHEYVQAASPYLPAHEGIRLLAPFRSNGGNGVGRPEIPEWPRWLWGALLALNVTMLIIIAVLLFVPL